MESPNIHSLFSSVRPTIISTPERLSRASWGSDPTGWLLMLQKDNFFPFFSCVVTEWGLQSRRLDFFVNIHESTFFKSQGSPLYNIGFIINIYIIIHTNNVTTRNSRKNYIQPYWLLHDSFLQLLNVVMSVSRKFQFPLKIIATYLTTNLLNLFIACFISLCYFSYGK